MSKTLFDILKIEVAAMYASKFFVDFPIPVKAALIAGMVITAAGAFVLYPKNERNTSNG